MLYVDNYIILIVLLMIVYVWSWRREPDGILSRTIRSLTHEKNYWRNRASDLQEKLEEYRR